MSGPDEQQPDPSRRRKVRRRVRVRIEEAPRRVRWVRWARRNRRKILLAVASVACVVLLWVLLSARRDPLTLPDG